MAIYDHFAKWESAAGSQSSRSERDGTGWGHNIAGRAVPGVPGRRMSGNTRPGTPNLQKLIYNTDAVPGVPGVPGPNTEDGARAAAIAQDSAADIGSIHREHREHREQTGETNYISASYVFLVAADSVPGVPATIETANPPGDVDQQFDQDDFEERAAIVQYEAGVPRAWAEGYARLQLLPRPEVISESRWRQLIDDGGYFLDEWGTQAAQLGWDVLTTFGISRRAPEHRLDMQGLVPSLCGHRVMALTAEAATIDAGGKAKLRIFRRIKRGAIPLWDLV